MTITGDQIAYLKETIAPLEAQRAVLGAAVIDSGLVSMQKQLAELQGQPELLPQQPKLTTILFTDLVGSTCLGWHLELDEVLEMMGCRLEAPGNCSGSAWRPRDPLPGEWLQGRLWCTSSVGE